MSRWAICVHYEVKIMQRFGQNLEMGLFSFKKEIMFFFAWWSKILFYCISSQKISLKLINDFVLFNETKIKVNS